MNNVLEQSMRLARIMGDVKKLPELTMLRKDIQSTWDKKKNKEYFGHHAPIKGLIPTPYEQLNNIILDLNIPVEYRDVVDPSTRMSQEIGTKYTRIQMPHPSVFKNQDRYATVLAHELGHATSGYVNRWIVNELLDLLSGKPMTRQTEEVVAELISWKLMQWVGVDSTEQASVFIGAALTWIADEDSDRHELLTIADKHAEKAFQFLIGEHHGKLVAGNPTGISQG